MSNKIEIELVEDAQGNVDLEQTLAAASVLLSERKAQRETQDDAIREALNVVFDTLRANHTRTNMPYVIGQVLQALNVSAMPQAYKTLEARIRGFIQTNSQGKILDKDTGAVERPDSWLVVSRGKTLTGSIARRADIEADAEAAEAVEAAKSTTAQA